MERKLYKHPKQKRKSTKEAEGIHNTRKSRPFYFGKTETGIHYMYK
jgi:hypothetical protein